MLAACYLPRGWPPKYCHRYESLRPCSGWERVVYSHLATSEFFEYAQNCIKYNFNHQILTLYRLLLHAPLSFTSFCLRKTVVHLTPRYFVLGASHRHTTQNLFRKSPRPISNAWLKMLPLLHLHPINVIIYNGTYWLVP